MEFELEWKPIDCLLLDPNNYRFFDLPQFKRKQEDRYHTTSVQDATLRLLESTPKYNLTELRNSLMANGYVPLERLVVVPYRHKEGLYFVVEGNRRVAALKTLLRDHADGVLTLSAHQIEDFSRVPVAIPTSASQQELGAIQRVLMGIRHIAGPQEWGAYQQALLIAQLVDEEHQGYDDVAKHLGLSALETRRRYRAIRALKQMEEDEVYSKVARPAFYRLLHELVSLPKVREYFSWDHEQAKFLDPEKARQFFELIEPLEGEAQAKLRTFSDVRSLRAIIGNNAAEAELLDPDGSFASALAKAGTSQNPQPTIDFMSEARRFYQLLSNVQLEAIAALTQDDADVLSELADLVDRRIEEHRKLNEE